MEEDANHDSMDTDSLDDDISRDQEDDSMEVCTINNNKRTEARPICTVNFCVKGCPLEPDAERDKDQQSHYLRIHAAGKPFIFTAGDDRYTLERNDQGLYVCICGKKFSQRDALKNHIKGLRSDLSLEELQDQGSKKRRHPCKSFEGLTIQEHFPPRRKYRQRIKPINLNKVDHNDTIQLLNIMKQESRLTSEGLKRQVKKLEDLRRHLSHCTTRKCHCKKNPQGSIKQAIDYVKGVSEIEKKHISQFDKIKQEIQQAHQNQSENQDSNTLNE